MLMGQVVDFGIGEEEIVSREVEEEHFYDRAVRRVRERGGLRAAQWVTNASVGEFTVCRVTYGTYHEYYTLDTATEEEALVVWLKGPDDWSTRWEISGGGEVGTGYSSGEGHRMHYLAFGRWDRRKESLELIARVKDREIGRTTIPNPGVSQAPELQAEELPARRQAGSLRVIFNGVDKWNRLQFELSDGARSKEVDQDNRLLGDPRRVEGPHPTWK